jgi:hypothetical protein
MGSKICAARNLSSIDNPCGICVVARSFGVCAFLCGVSFGVRRQDTLVVKDFGVLSVWDDFFASWSFFLEPCCGGLRSGDDVFEPDKTDTLFGCLEGLGIFGWVFDWSFIVVSSFSKWVYVFEITHMPSRLK